MLVDPCFQLLTPDDPMAEADWLRAANQLINTGATHLLLAPIHSPAPMFPERMQSLATMYQEMLDRRGLSLMIYPGQTVWLDQPLNADAIANEVLYADLNRRYLLVQAPIDIEVTTLLTDLFEPLRLDITPILANPERLTRLSDIDIQQLLEQGIKLMISGRSLLDKRYAKRVKRWLNRQWIVTIGSVTDSATSVDYRRVLRWLDQHVGRSYRDDLSLNDKALLNGDPFIEHHHSQSRRRLFRKRQ